MGTIFAHLELEDKLQVNDKTRLNAAKSFVARGTDALTDVQVKPGANGLAVSVFDSDPDNRYLEWEFNTWEGDFDASNNKLDFKENNGAELTATITPATYSLSALAAEVETQLNSAGAETYTVAASSVDKITISSTGKFSLLPTEGSNAGESILPFLGFNSIGGRGDGEWSNESTTTGRRVRYLPRKVTVTAINGVDPDSVEDKYFRLYSVEGDYLFSTDQDLAAKRSDILNYCERGRNTFKKYHRRAQEEIMDEFREAGFVDIYQDPLTLDAMVVPDDLRKYSTFKTLRMIFEDLSNATDDIFERIAARYHSSELKAKRPLLVRADLDRDGSAQVGEGVSVRSGRMIRL